MIDVEAIESIHLSKITPSMIKCVHGFNHFGIRSALINNNEIEESCPRCTADETWEHVSYKMCQDNRVQKRFHNGSSEGTFSG